MNKYKTIIFDLDGTLSNSKEGITKSVQYALQSAGIIEENLDALEHFIGPPIVDELIRTYGMSEEKAEQLKDKYRERYTPIGLYETSIYPGTEQMLSHLKESGKIVALATSKPTEMAVEVLKHLKIEQYFDYIMGAEMKGNRQSKEAVLRALLEEAGEIDVAEAIMIGDTCFDIDGAKKVGLETVCVTYGFGDNEEMKNHGAVALVDSALELEQFLLN